jgi:hypothetical protein
MPEPTTNDPLVVGSCANFAPLLGGVVLIREPPLGLALDSSALVCACHLWSEVEECALRAGAGSEERAPSDAPGAQPGLEPVRADRNGVGVREEDQLDDATRAFEDLQAEVMVLRRAVEALGPALKENRAPDYKPDPWPDHQGAGHGLRASCGDGGPPGAAADASGLWGAGGAGGGGRPRRQVLRDAEGAARAISWANQEAQAMLGSARMREAQNWHLLEVAVAGVMVGLILFPLLGFLLVRALPFTSWRMIMPDGLYRHCNNGSGCRTWSRDNPFPT